MSCKYQVPECNCSKLPLERTAEKVDIFFVTEFAGKTEAKEKKFLSGSMGKGFREILRVLKEKTNFTYAISAVTRSISKPNVLVHSSPQVKACLNNLRAEIERCSPKVIVLFDNLSYSVFSKHHELPKHGERVEDGRMIMRTIFGKKYPVMYCQHPNWYMKNESCAIGLLYRNIFKAIDYAKNKINPNIPNIVNTETLTTLKDVKDVLDGMRETEDYISVDTEDMNLNRVYENKILSVQVCNDGKVGYLIPYEHIDSPFLGKIDKLRKLLLSFFIERKSKALGYLFVNTKYDYHQLFRELRRFSFNAPILDVSYAEYSLEENIVRIKSFPEQKGPFSLFTMAYKRGYNFYSKTDSKEKRAILDKIPLKEWEEYAGADVIAPWHIFKKQLQEAERFNYKEGFLFLNMIYSNHLIRTLTYAEHCGLSVNRKMIESMQQSGSAIQDGIKDVMDRLYALPSVKEANNRLLKGKTGISTGLAGNVRMWGPKSPIHRELLYFDVMGLDPVGEDDDDKNNTHTGKTFQKNYEGVPEVDLLKEYNSFSKMKTGFLDPMSEYLNKNSPESSADMYNDDKARPYFFPMAVTGRLVCSKPNLQQRPAGRSDAAKKILSVYEPKKGKVVIKLDYKTFEVMGSGFLSDDNIMIKSFRESHKLKEQFRENPRCFADKGYKLQKDSLDDIKKELLERKQNIKDSKGVIGNNEYKEAKEKLNTDIEKYKESLEMLEKQRENDQVGLSMSCVTMLTDSHRKFASLFFKTPVASVSKVQRQAAKSLVFGLLYGMSLQSIAKLLKITDEEAQDLHDKYMKSFPEASKWLAKSKKFARKHFYVQSPLGRRRRLWGHLRLDKGVTSKMDRYAGNTVIQGVCSDCNVVADSLLIDVIEAHNKLKYQILNNSIWELVNLVHDSSEFEVPLEDAYYFIKEMEKIFTEYLTYYLREVFNFDIKIPLEVDFTIGTNYGNTRDWDGSEEDLINALKWLCEETAKRDGTDVVDYKKLINTKLYKEFPKGFVFDVIKQRVKTDLATIRKLGMNKAKAGVA